MNRNGLHKEPTTLERPIYGSSRLGILNKQVVFNLNGGLVSKSNSTIGIKEYELSDHLGNVSLVVLDRKKSLSTNIQPIIKSHTDYYPFGYPIASRSFSLEQYRFGFNGQEGDNEVYGDGKSYTAEYWQYDSRLGRRWNVDPIKTVNESSYSTNRNNPNFFSDPNGDCPDCKDGKYTIQKGDKFWDLEKNWNMETGTLSKMNPELDPKNLKIGQEIRVTLNYQDLPKGTILNSSKSLEGMDNFFHKGAKGVNRIKEVTEDDFNNLVKDKAIEYDKYLQFMNYARSKAMIKANSTGGMLDMKKYFIINLEQYSNDFSKWFALQNSISEPATRTLFLYKGYAYNLNEFGNLLFGAVHAKRGTSLKAVKIFGNIYSKFKNGSNDEKAEAEAIERGYGYGKQ